MPVNVFTKPGDRPSEVSPVNDRRRPLRCGPGDWAARSWQHSLLIRSVASGHALPLGRPVVKARHITLQQIAAVRLDALGRRADLKQLVRLSRLTLRARLPMFTRHEQNQWHLNSRGILKVSVGIIAPM